MKPRKRLARALRRQQKASAPPPSPFIDLTIPSAGEPSFKNGFISTWRLFKQAVRRPFASLALTLACAVIFTVIKMAIIYTVGLFVWAQAAPTAAVERYFNAGMWEIFSWAMAPLAMTPWLAASVVIANGLPVRWRLVKEPLVQKGRLLQLLLLGLFVLVIAGLAGASLGPSLAAVGPVLTVVWTAALYAVLHPTMLVALTAIWQDELPAHRAVVRSLVGWVGLWRPLLGSGACLLLLLLLVVAVLMVAVVLPLSAIHLPQQLMVVVGVVLLPLWLTLWAMWNQIHGGLALAYYDWSTPAVRKAPTL